MPPRSSGREGSNPIACEHIAGRRQQASSSRVPKESNISSAIIQFKGGHNLTVFRPRRIDEGVMVESPQSTNQEARENETSMLLSRSVRTSNLCARLFTEAETSSESAVMMVPFSDGPFSAIYSTIKMTQNESRVDNIIPVYLLNAEDYSRARPMATSGLEDLLARGAAVPFSTTYDGGSGERLLNSVQALATLCKRRNQLAANVRIQTGRFTDIQFNLDFYNAIDRLDFAYSEDSIGAYQVSDSGTFPSNWDVSETGDPNKVAMALLKQLLSLKGKFRDSPLQNVEVIRAHIIGELSRSAPNGITDKNLYKRLDRAYEKLTFLRTSSIQSRNDVTKRLVDSMIGCNIIHRDGQLLRPSDKGWHSKSNMIDCYLAFCDLRRSGLG